MPDIECSKTMQSKAFVEFSGRDVLDHWGAGWDDRKGLLKSEWDTDM